MKKTISMILALVMVQSVITPAFALKRAEITQLEEEINALEIKKEELEKKYSIVWIEGYVIQNGSTFIVDVINDNDLVSVVESTALQYWIDDPNVLQYDPQVDDYFAGCYQYLGKDYLFRADGTRIIINRMGPAPADYEKVCNDLSDKTETLLSNPYGARGSDEVIPDVNDGTVDTSLNGFLPVYYNGYISEEGMFENGLQQGWFASYDENHNMLEPMYYIDSIEAWSPIETARPLFETDDALTNTIFMQIGNPFFFSYGDWKYHESQNINAAPVATPEGRTLIPIRSFIESIYGVVEWDSNNNQVTVQLNPSNRVVFTIGKGT